MMATSNSKDMPARFWAKVDKRGADECWPWLASTFTRGYGQFWRDGRLVRATKVSWELANGRPFPDGLCACHSCDNPNCVNPSHIWPGTLKDNARDAVSKGHFVRKRKLDRDELVRLRAEGKSYSEIARQCGVDRSTAVKAYQVLRRARTFLATLNERQGDAA